MNQLPWNGILQLTLVVATLTLLAGKAYAATPVKQPYQPTWNSLKNVHTPQWLRDGKFGIYTHWGVYSVPAQGPAPTWFTNKAYMDANSPERKFWEDTYGPITKFGYKDFIPMFTAEKFNADEWADLFEKSGARFAGPVAEHHDGFSMWDSKINPWNSVKMGPKRDIVGELAKAIKKRDMKFVTAFHHAENWVYFPTSNKSLDCGDPRYSGLYGVIHEPGAQPTKEFLDPWKAKFIEVIDKYDPDMIWIDYGLFLVSDSYKQEVLAYYYNKAAARKKEVSVAYKMLSMPYGVGIIDHELGQEADLTDSDWITDTDINRQNFGYVIGQGWQTLDSLIDNLVDRVSKNGYLLLNVGPKPDGTIPDEAKRLLLGMGNWLKINGEAIYGTTPWVTAGEGPTRLPKLGPLPDRGCSFNERNDQLYTAEDIRFTVKGNNLYATVLAWPGEKLLIKSLSTQGLWAIYKSEIASITMLGDGKELKWELTKEGLSIDTPKTQPCEHAFVFKIERRHPFGVN